ncbi:hypothetical protein PMALA_015880 [Plasmodium malariae]|uniref:Uncharacterized protein n=1 Tax=Plasmodium malariae TaxID=5858 RepID=A0A1A8W341_PLAMA|nr:hypothetical protein PMALA_015880 [Plasmodium malariae]
MTTSQSTAIFGSDLQTFIVTKYDPLLTIVKELNDKLQNSEKALLLPLHLYLSTFTSPPLPLHLYHSTCITPPLPLHLYHSTFTSPHVPLHMYHSTCTTPCLPSFQLSDKYRLEKRLIRLEKQMLVLLDKLEVTDIPVDLELKEKKEEQRKNQKIENEENLLAPWLFSCQLGTPLSSLQVLLEFTVQNTIELNVKLWKREDDMWINFLEIMSSNTKNYLPDSLNLIELRKATRKCLLNLCTSEILIVLRNVPGKSQAVYNTTTMTLVAILASAVYEAWKRIELTDPVSLGRIVLVLDGMCGRNFTCFTFFYHSIFITPFLPLPFCRFLFVALFLGEDVGSRLRAGNKKLKIEPLN